MPERLRETDRPRRPATRWDVARDWMLHPRLRWKHRDAIKAVKAVKRQEGNR